jgi:hypothetical protein
MKNWTAHLEKDRVYGIDLVNKKQNMFFYRYGSNRRQKNQLTYHPLNRAG